MSDYTDIKYHLEKSREELLIVKDLLRKNQEFGEKINPKATWAYIENVASLARVLDRVIDETDNFTDLIEKGIKK